MAASNAIARSSPEPFYVLRPNAGEVVDLKFITEQSADIIAYGTVDGVIGLVCLDSKRTVWSYRTSTGKPVIGIDVWNGHQVVSICRGNVAEVLDTATQQQTYQCAVNNPGFCKLCVLQKQEAGACEFANGSTEYGKVCLYSTNAEKPSTVLSTDLAKSLGSCMAVQYFATSFGSGSQVLAGFESGHLVHWDTRNPSVVMSSIKLYEEPVMCLQYSTAHNLGVAGSPSKVVKTVHFNEKDGVQLGYEVEVQSAGQCDVSLRHDGRIFATGGWDNRLRVYGCRKGKWLAALEHHTAAVSAVEFYPSPSPSLGNLVAAGSRDERISLWRLY